MTARLISAWGRTRKEGVVLGKWLFGRRDAAPETSRVERMRAVPRVREGVCLERNARGEPVLLVRPSAATTDKERGLISQFIRPRPRQVILDDLGGFVFERVDGTRCVGDIVGDFSDAYHVHAREAEAAVWSFLEMLVGRKVLLVGVLEE
jgi:hypothetical protein